MGSVPDKDTKKNKISVATIPERIIQLPEGKEFKSWVEMALVQDNGKLGNNVKVQTYELSTRHIGLNSRHMMHIGTHVVIIIHKIDARPTIVYGTVHQCDYTNNGMHNIIVTFEEKPENL